MSSYLLDVFAAIGAIVCLHQLNSWKKKRSGSLPLPPGPKGLPLIGNILDMPKAEEWEAARKWGDIYGPMVYIENLGTSYIFLNTYQSAVDLFEKRGHNYSSRPKNVMIDLEGWGWFIAIMPYGDELRRSRQMLHRFFQPSIIGDYAELQTQAAHRMLERLLKSPEEHRGIIRYSTGELILMMCYGYKAEEKNDYYINLVEKGVEAFVEAEGFFLVNAIPWLQYLPAWLPGMGFLKTAREGHKHSMRMYREPYKMAKEKFLDGTAVPSMSSKLLEAFMAGDTAINDEALIAKVTGISYAAGADTTVSAMLTFFLAMLLNPEAQRRGQEELDKVVGKDNLPTLEDRPNLPYIEAICKESLRWHTIAPLGVAHTATEDDEYDGYFVPGGTVVLSNLWAILRDPVEYPEPEKFIPERWLPKKGKKVPLDVHKVVWGIGRRICPGRHFAESSIFIGVASILSAFRITTALDDKGVPITPDGEYTTHFVRYPKPFKYVINPRSDKIAPLVHQAVESATQVAFHHTLSGGIKSFEEGPVL